MKHRLGIDIDGTVTCPSTFIPYLNEAFGKELALHDITQYNLAPLYGVAEEEMDRWLAENEAGIYERAPLARYALEVIDSWKDKYELYYISARGRHLYELTERWFQRHGIHYHHIELIGSHDKIAAVRQYRLAAFLKINTITLVRSQKHAASRSFCLTRHTTKVRFLTMSSASGIGSRPSVKSSCAWRHKKNISRLISGDVFGIADMFRKFQIYGRRFRSRRAAWPAFPLDIYRFLLFSRTRCK